MYYLSDYDFLELTKDKKNKVKVKKYLDNFIDDKLKVEKKEREDEIQRKESDCEKEKPHNFSLQEKIFFSKLKQECDLIIGGIEVSLCEKTKTYSYESIKYPKFLIIHALYALDMLNYLETQDVYIYLAKAERYPPESLNLRLIPVGKNEIVLKFLIKEKLLDRMNEIDEKSPSVIDIHETIIFDKEKSLLFIGNKSVEIEKFSDQFNFLRILLVDDKNKFDLTGECFFSVIAEIEDQYVKNKDKKFYNAVYQIKQKLKTIGVEDCFITTTQSISINKKYLS